MFEKLEDGVEISFQWVVGDTRALEKNLISIGRSDYQYAITVVSRLIAFGLTFLVAWALIPGTELWIVFLISLAGSYSLWVSWGVSVLSLRALERLTAKDNRKVGWNTVWLDQTGITWSNETSQDYTSWLGVSDVVEQDGSIWIKTGPAHGFYIPPRVFGSPREQSECMSAIEAYRSNPVRPRHLRHGDEEMVKH